MFEGVSVFQGGAAALLTLVILLIITGKLGWYRQWEKQLEDTRRECDKRVEQANAETVRWRSAFEYSEQARRIDAEHADKLLQLGYATNRVISALPVAPKGEPDASASVVVEG